jgi:hypothetical protein
LCAEEKMHFHFDDDKFISLGLWGFFLLTRYHQGKRTEMTMQVNGDNALRCGRYDKDARAE